MIVSERLESIGAMIVLIVVLEAEKDNESFYDRKKKKNDDGIIEALIPYRKIRLVFEKFEYLISIY